MQISRQDVEKVATLARLHVTESETTAFAKQLSEILAHVEQLSRYDTSGVEPTTTV
ncbi:MAG: Asp-tRNA(Asn)/Glu-tRNA(Gln) amidotransferase subunit GatC, partial [Nitrospira sp.]|nr:Asp-tRNA(Asn)/Glu-tRNA(Gln) amidotransferase subunit GatC [Nitrospira sp.]